MMLVLDQSKRLVQDDGHAGARRIAADWGDKEVKLSRKVMHDI